MNYKKKWSTQKWRELFPFMPFCFSHAWCVAHGPQRTQEKVSSDTFSRFTGLFDTMPLTLASNSVFSVVTVIGYFGPFTFAFCTLLNGRPVTCHDAVLLKNMHLSSWLYMLLHATAPGRPAVSQRLALRQPSTFACLSVGRRSCHLKPFCI